MTQVKLRQLDRFRDRHGRWRYYFRRGKGARVSLPDKPGSETFMRAYQAALVGRDVEKQPVPQRGDPGTFDRLVQDYFSSPSFLDATSSMYVS